MVIDNFVKLFSDSFFSYSDIETEVALKAVEIYTVLQFAPSDIDQFVTSLREKRILNKSTQDYFHIADYFEDDNLYLRKSVRFVQWFGSKWPQYQTDLYQSLSESQLKRVARLTSL